MLVGVTVVRNNIPFTMDFKVPSHDAAEVLALYLKRGLIEEHYGICICNNRNELIADNYTYIVHKSPKTNQKRLSNAKYSLELRKESSVQEESCTLVIQSRLDKELLQRLLKTKNIKMLRRT